MKARGSQRILLLVVASLAVTSRARAADLKPETVAGFERYQAAAEAAIAADTAIPARFLRIRRGVGATGGKGENPEEQLRQGHVLVAQLELRDHGKTITTPGGLIHHWVGATFVPGVHVRDAVTLMQDYDRHQEIFKPAIGQSKTLEHDGDRFRFLLRFVMKKVITVVVNTESIAEFTWLGTDRAVSTIRSTRVQEVGEPGTPREHQKPEGHDGGYLWRLNTYWRFLERDGGTYIECESLTLTRPIPIGMGWIIGPFVSSIPRELLGSTLVAARKTLLAAAERIALGRCEQPPVGLSPSGPVDCGRTSR